MQTQLPPILVIVFTVVTAVGVMLQACVLLGMYIAVRKATKKFHDVSDELRVHLLPTLAATRSLLQDISPKVKETATDVAEIARTVRDQTRHANAAVDDVLNKTTAQVARVDEMTGAVLNSVEHAATVVQHSLIGPYRRIAGIMAGLQAGFDVLVRKRNQPSVDEVEVAEEVIPR